MIIYALYDGEYIVAEGSVREIAIQIGISENTVRWYGTQQATDRNINKALVKSEEDEDMIVGSNIPRTQRSVAVKTPIPSNYETETTAPVKMIYRPVQHKAWKPSSYVAQLSHNCFKNWYAVE